MEIDTSNMRQVILDFPKQLGEGLALAKNANISGEFKNITVCGMGGSALPAEILIDLQVTKIPVFIHRDYDLPPQPGKHSLVICISYSGNTEETVSSLQAAISKNMHVVTIATGGTLEALAKKHNLPFVKIHAVIQSRSATGCLFGALVRILENTETVGAISPEIPALASFLEEKTAVLEIQGKDLAKKITHKIPVVYAAEHIKSVAQLWKIKFNENSKIPAFFNVLPELNHNEMVGFTNRELAKHLVVITLQNNYDHLRIQKRQHLTAQVIKERGAGHEFIALPEGKNALETIFASLLLGDWTSYYLALEQGIDPSPVEIVEQFKKDLVK